MWDSEILYADSSSKDKQTLILSLLGEAKNTNMQGGINLKFTFHFMEITHEPCT
jgi:hypothetical protein